MREMGSWRQTSPAYIDVTAAGALPPWGTAVGSWPHPQVRQPLAAPLCPMIGRGRAAAHDQTVPASGRLSPNLPTIICTLWSLLWFTFTSLFLSRALQLFSRFTTTVSSQHALPFSSLPHTSSASGSRHNQIFMPSLERGGKNAISSLSNSWGALCWRGFCQRGRSGGDGSLTVRSDETVRINSCLALDLCLSVLWMGGNIFLFVC
jgi:hypothetical protein